MSIARSHPETLLFDIATDALLLEFAISCEDLHNRMIWPTRFSAISTIMFLNQGGEAYSSPNIFYASK